MVNIPSILLPQTNRIMKRFTMTIVLAVLLGATQFAKAQSPVITITGYISSNTTWTKDNIYLLSGFVYVNNGATLTIEPGTLIKGDKFTKGALIVSRGAKLMADGTVTEPIVFTSNGPAGFRTYGDWGGIILLGKASINQPGGEAIIEGGVDDGLGNGTYGGGLTPDDNDNSGIVRYVRIEYPGIAFTSNNEINGLTCGGIGSGTILEHIQVSYSGDDAFEFFGGTVNAKHLIAFRALDDDFDTDNGYRGKLQFLYSLRDPNVADISSSNGFESDNDATGSTNTPVTHPIMGYPSGLMIDGSATEGNATSGILQVRNTVLSGCTNNFEVASGSTFDIGGWFNTASFGNTTYPANADVMLTDAFNLSGPNPLPAAGSPVLTGASFADLTDSFFEVVTYRGAFGTTDWTLGWAEWNPNNANYTFINEIKNLTGIGIYPNPMSSQSTLEFNLLEAGNVNIVITDLSGRFISQVMNSQMAAGNHSVEIFNKHLSAGMYFIQMRTGNDNLMVKLHITD